MFTFFVSLSVDMLSFEVLKMGSSNFGIIELTSVSGTELLSIISLPCVVSLYGAP
jgi:hypothetical protein